MISDELILINRLWDISLQHREGKILEMKEAEKFWKQRAHELIVNYNKRKKKFG